MRRSLSIGAILFVMAIAVTANAQECSQGWSARPPVFRGPTGNWRHPIDADRWTFNDGPETGWRWNHAMMQDRIREVHNERAMAHREWQRRHRHNPFVGGWRDGK